MRTAMPEVELQHCPACGSPVRPCTEQTVCTVCQFTYDAYTRVWRSAESWRRVAANYATLGILVGCAAAILYRLQVAHAPNPMLPLILGLAAPVLGLGLRCLISGRITGRFVALTPPGILVGTRRRPTLLPWADFDQLTDQRGVPKLRLHASETLVPLEDIFASAQELADFRSALHAAAQRYRATRPGRAPLPRTPEDWRP